MRDLRCDIFSALNSLDTNIYYGYPKQIVESENVLIRQAENRCISRADGIEQLSELIYAIDIFTLDSERAYALLNQIDTRLSSMGLTRKRAHEIFERDTKYTHISASYACKIDTLGNIYQ